VEKNQGFLGDNRLNTSHQHALAAQAADHTLAVGAQPAGSAAGSGKCSFPSVERF